MNIFFPLLHSLMNPAGVTQEQQHFPATHWHTYQAPLLAVCACKQHWLNAIGLDALALAQGTKHISAAPPPPVLSSSIIIQLCLPLAVKTALDNSLRRRQLHRNILLAAVMSAVLQTHGHEHMAPCYRFGRRIHDFGTVSPIFSLPGAILLPYYDWPLPAGNPTCRPMQYSSFARDPTLAPLPLWAEKMRLVKLPLDV